MKKLSNIWNAKSYLILFSIVMVLNIGATVLLIRNSFGQSAIERKPDRSPIATEVVVQENSPLRLSVTGIDNSNPDYQLVNYLVENTAKNSIRAYVVLGSNKTDELGTAITRRFASKMFQPGDIENGWFNVERKDIKPESKLYLSTDYVEFDDGRSWGSDVAGQSEYIAGSQAGWKDAVDHANSLLKTGRSNSLIDLLEKEKEPTLPEVDSGKSEKWRKGYLSAHRTVLSTLREQFGIGGLKAVTEKLNEMTEGCRFELRQRPFPGANAYK
jgi:hypothetical protein